MAHKINDLLEKADALDEQERFDEADILRNQAAELGREREEIIRVVQADMAENGMGSLAWSAFDNESGDQTSIEFWRGVKSCWDMLEDAGGIN